MFSWGAGCWEGRSLGLLVHFVTHLWKSLSSSSADPVLDFFFSLVASLSHGAMGIFLGSSPVHVPQGSGELGCPWWEKHPSSQHPPRISALRDRGGHTLALPRLPVPALALGSEGLGQEAWGQEAVSCLGDGAGTAGAVLLWLIGRSRLGWGHCSQKPGSTEPRRSLYFRGSGVQILCKALCYITEPLRPPRIDGYKLRDGNLLGKD